MKRVRNIVILLVITRNKYLLFVHCSWQVAPKILEISYIRSTGASFIIFGLLYSVPETTSEHEGKTGVSYFS